LDRGTAQRPGDGRALPDRLALRGDRLGTYEDLTHDDLRLGLAGDLPDLAVLLVDNRAGLRRGAEVDRAEDIGVVPVVVLRPAVEGVLVALGALEPDAQEGDRRLFAPLLDRHGLQSSPEQV